MVKESGAGSNAEYYSSICAEKALSPETAEETAIQEYVDEWLYHDTYCGEYELDFLTDEDEEHVTAISVAAETEG